MIRIYLAVAFLCFLTISTAFSQSLSLSPYSRYGIGEIIPTTTTRNMSMGDIGVATQNYASVNRLNPASYTDILYTTLDISAFGRYSELTSSNNSETQGTAGFKNISFAFPTNKKVVIAFGFAPYSAVGYDISTKYPVMIEDSIQTGIARYNAEGGLNQAFIGVAAKTLKRKLSIGVNGYYSFGTVRNSWESSLENANLASFNDVQISRNAFISGVGVQGGVIYSDTLSGHRPKSTKAIPKPLTLLRIGATVDYGIDLNADRVTSFSNRFVVDSLGGADSGKIVIPPKFGLGFAITRPGHYEISAEATYQDWKQFQYFDDEIELNAALRLAAGAEWIPEINSVKYQKRIAYRIGGYFDRSYLIAGGEAISDIGFTFGVGLPAGLKGTTLFNRERAYSRINLGFGIGKRGDLKAGQPLEELYYRVNIGITVNEKWFRKIRVD